MQGGQMAAKDNVDGRHCSSELEREWELQGCNKCQVKGKKKFTLSDAFLQVAWSLRSKYLFK